MKNVDKKDDSQKNQISRPPQYFYYNSEKKQIMN